MKAVLSTKRRGYNPLPLRRIYIEKKNKKLRPISILAMQDRAVQVLHRLSLEPVAEEKADPNSYGFLPKRSTMDAIAQCFTILARKSSAQWVLEGDIKGCFDNFESSWLEANIPMDKVILKKLLKAGYMEKDTVFPTLKGVPQGGPLSTTITLIALSGLETKLRLFFKKSKVNFVSYADDFIISGDSKEILELEVKPVVEQFLKERGLELSQEKTRITPIEEGFDFLGFNVRKYNGKLLIKPSKANIKKFTSEISEIIKSNRAAKTENLIYFLNSKIRGWANYYRHVVSSKNFSKIDTFVYQTLDRWIRGRHRNKGKRWMKNNYFRTRGLDQWQFFAKVKRRGKLAVLELAKARRIHIRRHVKIKSIAHPYNPDFKDYLIEREQKRKADRQFIPLLTIIPDGSKSPSFKGLSVIL